ncbi:MULTISPECIES: hypothetical protein [Priestia]|uniref:hypothetical protein n=1 Tax=Priestia TaxID=2800373 RepID=UPI002E1BC7D7|nr:hypothetical protein [Priestia aryabhattai]
MSSLKTYLEDDNEIYGEVNLMISTKNQERINKLYEVFPDDYKITKIINRCLEEGLSKFEEELRKD